jgi:VIT1/CCC1 family predicted Fe2+/Mn2+ transporter
LRSWDPTAGRRLRHFVSFHHNPDIVKIAGICRRQMRDNPVRQLSPSKRGPMPSVIDRLAAIPLRVRAFFEPPASPHETRGASVVRPIVFGATDGLVCNLSLIMGVAGAAGEDPHSIIIAGVAGLLAGGFSMAVGEYVSVRSQRELLEYQIDLQRHQLHHTPEQERGILREIYEAKGLSWAEADLIVRRIMRDPERAIDTFVREEIGLSAETMGSPVAAGLGSLCAFALGAFVPLLPFLILGSGQAAFALSIAASGIALFAVGLGVSRLTHRRAIWTGVRQAGLGGLAAAVTFGIGSLLGTAVH